jgi:hypothetical protein
MEKPLFDYKKEINNGNLCLVVSLDLAKAFDVIMRELLLQKLKRHGIDTKWYAQEVVMSECLVHFSCQVYTF